jgi:hypothetical protein
VRDSLPSTWGDERAFPDRVRFYAPERENVGQEGYDALVHRACPSQPPSLANAVSASSLGRAKPTKPINGHL